MRNAMLMVGILSVVALAGCVGSEEDVGEPASAPEDAAPASYDEESGAVEGLVTDDEFVPVVGAIVALQGLEENQAMTAANGRFSLSNIPPGDHVLLVQALGYESLAQRIEVRIGEVSFVEISLVPLPSQEPYVSSENHQGQYGTGAAVIRTTFCLGCSSNDTAWFVFNNGDGLPLDFAGMVVEAEWSTQDYLGFDFNQRSSPAQMWYRWRGQSPMHFFVERCGEYLGAPHFGRQPMPCTDADLEDNATGAHLETWYVGLFEDEFGVLDPVCQEPVPGVLPGYEAGCYGAGTAPELRWSTWVSFFHKELPPNAAGFSVFGDR